MPQTRSYRLMENTLLSRTVSIAAECLPIDIELDHHQFDERLMEHSIGLTTTVSEALADYRPMQKQDKYNRAKGHVAALVAILSLITETSAHNFDSIIENLYRLLKELDLALDAARKEIAAHAAKKRE